jgi:hypothetical protein
VASGIALWATGFLLDILERNSKGRFLSISRSSEEDEVGLAISSVIGDENGNLGTLGIFS